MMVAQKESVHIDVLTVFVGLCNAVHQVTLYIKVGLQSLDGLYETLNHGK